MKKAEEKSNAQIAVSKDELCPTHLEAEPFPYLAYRGGKLVKLAERPEQEAAQVPEIKPEALVRPVLKRS